MAHKEERMFKKQCKPDSTKEGKRKCPEELSQILVGISVANLKDPTKQVLSLPFSFFFLSLFLFFFFSFLFCSFLEIDGFNIGVQDDFFGTI